MCERPSLLFSAQIIRYHNETNIYSPSRSHGVQLSSGRLPDTTSAVGVLHCLSGFLVQVPKTSKKAANLIRGCLGIYYRARCIKYIPALSHLSSGNRRFPINKVGGLAIVLSSEQYSTHLTLRSVLLYLSCP
jgi:hypothetical protein